MSFTVALSLFEIMAGVVLLQSFVSENVQTDQSNRLTRTSNTRPVDLLSSTFSAQPRQCLLVFTIRRQADELPFSESRHFSLQIIETES